MGILGHLRQNIKPQLGRGLIIAVGVTDGDGQSIHPGFLLKAHRVRRVRAMHSDLLRAILRAAYTADLRLHGSTVRARHLYNTAGLCYILIQRQMRAVKHHGGKAQLQCLADLLLRFAVVKVHRHRHACLPGSGHHQGTDQLQRRLAQPHLRNLEDHRDTQFLCRLQHTQHHLHIGNGEGANGIAADTGIRQQITHIHQHRHTSNTNQKIR